MGSPRKGLRAPPRTKVTWLCGTLGGGGAVRGAGFKSLHLRYVKRSVTWHAGGGGRPGASAERYTQSHPGTPCGHYSSAYVHPGGTTTHAHTNTGAHMSPAA